jgi:hypothetical protein
MSASGASAASPLFLKSKGGVVAPPGTPTKGVLYAQIGGYYCYQYVNGALASNATPKDKAKFSAIEAAGCAEGSPAGLMKEVELTSKGQFTMKFGPKLAITVPGPCVYEASKLKGTFTIPGITYTNTFSGVGKLNKKLSLGTCAKTALIEGNEASIYDSEAFEYYTAET